MLAEELENHANALKLYKAVPPEVSGYTQRLLRRAAERERELRRIVTAIVTWAEPYDPDWLDDARRLLEDE